MKPNTTPAGAVIIGGDFQGLGVIRSLASHGVPIYLLDEAMCMARFSRHVNRFARHPGTAKEEALLRFLMDLGKREDLVGWAIYPNSDDVVRFLAKHRDELEAIYRVTTPPWEMVKTACDKRCTYELAEELGIPVPQTLYPASLSELEQMDVALPAVLKPTVKEPFYSVTGKKAIRVDTREQLLREFAAGARAAGESGIVMVQELVVGGSPNLFSVGSLARDGEMLAWVVARRPRQHPMDFGHATTYAETVSVPEIEESARRILAAMSFRGLSEIEFMLDEKDGRYKLIEINPRPWGWHTLAVAAGVDLPYLAYLDIIGESVGHNGSGGDARWIRLLTDAPTAVRELLGGRMGLLDYLRTLRGKKQFAVLSWSDPLPFLAEVLMLPYLWKKRGF